MHAMTLALHPSTGEQECRAAFLGILRIARARGLGPQQLIDLLCDHDDEYEDDDEDDDPEPFQSSIRVTFGRFRGKTLGEIARESPDYLAWMSRDIREPGLRRAAKIVHEWVMRQ